MDTGCSARGEGKGGFGDKSLAIKCMLGRCPLTISGGGPCLGSIGANEATDEHVLFPAGGEGGRSSHCKMWLYKD